MPGNRKGKIRLISVIGIAIVVATLLALFLPYGIAIKTNGLVSFSVALAQGEGWWNPDWSYRKKLTFDNSGQNEDLVNFSVLVKLTTSNFDFSKAQSAGQDIRFVDADDSTVLKYEIETWTANTEAWIWVKVPQIDALSTTDFIYMYYGNPGASDAQDAVNVWDSNFKAVWHLKEDPYGTAPQMKDSTSNANHGTSQGSMTSGDQVSAKINGGLDFDGSDDKITVSDSTSLSFTGNELTIEAWVKVDTLPGTDPNADETAILRKDEQWQIAFQTANSIRNLVRTSGTTGWTTANDENYSFATNTWYYWTFVYNGSNVRHMINAQQIGNPHTVTGNIVDNANNVEIGRCNYTNKFLDGIIDEVRISNIARSAAWIKAQYLSTSLTFITFGNEEAEANISEDLPISESVSVVVYRLNRADVSDNLPISESVLARKFTPSFEDLPISESVSVAVYRLYRGNVSDNLPLSESVLANKFTPRFENLPISDLLSVAVYRFNSGDVAETIAISDGVQVHRYSPLLEGVTLSESVLANKFTPSSEDIAISDSLSVAVYRFTWGGISPNLFLRYILDDFHLSEAVLVEKLTGGENMPISDSVSVTIYRATPPVTPVKPINWWLIGGIIAAVVAVALAIFLLRRRMLF